MKLKFHIDKQTVQDFLITHVEKMVLAVFVVVSLLIIYRAMGASGFDKKPSELVATAQNAEAHVDKDRTEELKKDIKLRVEDYPAVARRSRIPVEEKYYAHTRPWDQPIGKKDARRGPAPVLAVRSLEAFGDRGTLTLSRSDVAGAGTRAVGRRWVLLTGVVPVREQYQAYRDAFAGSAYYNQTTDVPEWRYFIVERAEAPPGRPIEEAEYQPFDLEKLKSVFQEINDFVIQPDIYPEWASISRLALPLPARLDKPWGDRAYPLVLTGPRFEDVRRNPAKYKGQRVVWHCEGGSQEQNRARVVYARRPFGAARDTAPEYFAVDYPSVEAAKQLIQQSAVEAVVVGSDMISLRDETTRTSQRVEVPLLKYDPSLSGQPVETTPADPLDPLSGLGGTGNLAAGGEGAAGGGYIRRPAHNYPQEEAGAATADGRQLPEMTLFRFIDLNVKPGYAYRYRVKLVLRNPNYNRPEYQLLDPKEAKQQLIESPLTEPTATVVIPQDVHLLAIEVNPPRGTAESSAKVAVVKWIEESGLEAYKDFSTWRGAMLNFPEALFPPTGPIKAKAPRPTRPTRPAAEGGTRPARRPTTAVPDEYESEAAYGTQPEAVIQQVKVNYSTGALTLDMRGGEKLPFGRPPMVEAGDVLVLDSVGRLQVYCDIDGKPEFDRRAEELKKTTETGGPTVTVPGPTAGEGGLDF